MGRAREQPGPLDLASVPLVPGVEAGWRISDR